MERLVNDAGQGRGREELDRSLAEAATRHLALSLALDMVWAVERQEQPVWRGLTGQLQAGLSGFAANRCLDEILADRRELAGILAQEATSALESGGGDAAQGLCGELLVLDAGDPGARDLALRIGVARPAESRYQGGKA